MYYTAAHDDSPKDMSRVSTVDTSVVWTRRRHDRSSAEQHGAAVV